VVSHCASVSSASRWQLLSLRSVVEMTTKTSTITAMYAKCVVIHSIIIIWHRRRTHPNVAPNDAQSTVRALCSPMSVLTWRACQLKRCVAG
jgi:hypothetical protein